MADSAHSSSNHHSSGLAAVSGENNDSPQSQRGSLPSPWPEVVRGEQEPTWVVRHSPPSSASSLSSLAMSQEQTPFVDCSATQVAHSPLPLPPENSASAENYDENHVNTAAQNKKPAWNKASDGVVEVGPVMGAVCSPTLSESTEAPPEFQTLSESTEAPPKFQTLSESSEASPKYQDKSSKRAAADGSTSASQVPANMLHPRNHVVSNATPHYTTNHAMPNWQRFSQCAIHSCKGGGPPLDGFIRPSPAPAPAPSFSMFQVPHSTYSNLVPPMPDTSFREPSYLSNNWNLRPIGGYLPLPHPVNDHHGMSWRGNINPYVHTNSVHQNNKNRAYHNRGSFVNGRNVHMFHQRPHPRSSWGPSTPSPYMPPTRLFSPQLVRAYGNHIFYQVPFDAFPLEHYRGPQYMPQHPIIQSISEPPVSTLLVNQINYYFCDANLVDDNFLKSHMDDQGWVSIDLVAGFPRVKKLTNDIRLILDSLRASTIVEVQGDKIRRRHEWINWIPNTNPTPALSPSGSSEDLLTNVPNLKIEEDRGDDTGNRKGLLNGENIYNVDSGK